MEEADADTAGTDIEAGEEHFRVPLLLHSLAEFRELIFTCLDLAEITSVAEVGAEDGLFTQELLKWGAPGDARVIAIDPYPSERLSGLAHDEPRLDLRPQTSIDALAELELLDAYLIDGDHNYFTVTHELAAIARAAEGGSFPLIFLHDVGWPCGRRDFYYAPDAIPEDARHPFTFEQGVVPGESGTVDGGYRGHGEFAVAREEGGAANGVQTAVDDFLADRPDLSYATVPCVFGLGVLYPSDAPYAEQVAERIALYREEPLFARLEENRIVLFLRVLELQDLYAALIDSHSNTLKALEQSGLHIRDLQVENRALWARQAELGTDLERERAAGDELRRAIAALAESRAFVAAELFQRLRSLTGGGGSSIVSRAELRKLLEEQTPKLR